MSAKRPSPWLDDGLSASGTVPSGEAADQLGRVRTRAYRNGVLQAEDFPLAEVSTRLEHPDASVWVDLCAPSPSQLEMLADELELHELAVEDVVGHHRRPKLDRYATHLFLSCYAVRVDIEQADLEETGVDAFIGARWLVTVRESEQFPISPVLRRWGRSADLAVHGVAFLLHGLIDAVVETYFDAIDAFDEYYERMSDEIFAEHPLNLTQQRQWFEMRRRMVRFHRLVMPMREAVSSLMRREGAFIPDELYPYFQDVYDHILRVSESTESLRDLVSSIAEANISLRDYRQNQIAKKVSGWAAIIAVPAVITGFYGMNVPYPGSGETAGFVASLVLLTGASGGLFLLFRRLDWL